MRSVAPSPTPPPPPPPPPPLGPSLRNETKCKNHQVFGNVEVEE
jgi:hypothetical protein